MSTRATRKAWVRYPPPRWIWSGTAICGIPSEVSRAMLRGWHANNGVVLGNPQARLRLHRADRRRPARARRLLQGVGSRSRARGAIAVFARRTLSAVPGRSRAAPARATRGRKNGCKKSFATMRWSTSPRSCRRRSGCSARKKAAISQALRPGWSECTPSTRSLGCWAAWKRARQVSPRPSRGCRAGRTTTRNCSWKARRASVRQTSWRLMAEREALSPAVFDAWNELWIGAALAHDRFMRVEVTRTSRPRRRSLVLAIQLSERSWT